MSIVSLTLRFFASNMLKFYSDKKGPESVFSRATL